MVCVHFSISILDRLLFTSVLSRLYILSGNFLNVDTFIFDVMSSSVFKFVLEIKDMTNV